MNKRFRCNAKGWLSGLLVVSMTTTFPQSVQAQSKQPLQKGDWSLVWSDEFNSNTLDSTKWSYDVGNWIIDQEGNPVDSGWGNNELEYYTPGDNLSFRDGNLVITAKKEAAQDEYGSYDYTSSKIKTQGNFAKKYGRFEAKIKMPDVEGLWPAFWMMPENDVYGGWAASGELDIMEARGRKPGEVEGTLHYGGTWPNNRHSGNFYHFDEGNDFTDFHEYAVEWEPGEIRWYVDDELYATQNNWYTKGSDGEEKYAFPAPFDQEFYLILNLAVGGWFDNNITPPSDFESAEMLVDYVRVYELTGRDYLTPQEPNIDAEPFPEDARPAINGNFVYDTNYQNGITLVDDGMIPFSDTWNLVTLPDFHGKATASIEAIDGSHFAKIEALQSGSQTYAIQLIQRLPLIKGRTYRVSYDAFASSNRKMNVKLSGGEDRGWVTYSDEYSPSLTPTLQHFEHEFKMEATTDLQARLEFNLGLSTTPLWIGNVKVEEVEPVIDYDASKKPLSNGNHIYNGAFDKGEVDRLTYWNLLQQDGKAKMSVDEATRELFVNVTKQGSAFASTSIEQKGILLAQDGLYELRFDARTNASTHSANPKDIQVVLKNSDGDIVASSELIPLTKNMTNYTVNFDVLNQPTDANGSIEFLVGGTKGNVYLDNVTLLNHAMTTDYTPQELFPLQNGSFQDGERGLQNWSAWNWTSYDAFLDLIHVKDGFATIPVSSFPAQGDGAQTWGVQFKQSSLPIVKGAEYVVSFDAFASLPREMELVIQNAGYYRHLSEQVSLSTTPQRYTFSFVASGSEMVELNFLLGKYADLDAHEVMIDNVVFEIKNNPTNQLANSTFDEELQGWTTWSDAFATSYVDHQAMKVDVPWVGNAFWSTQIIQDQLFLEQGKTYRLTFDMASTQPRTIQALVEGNQKYLWESFSIDETLSTYTVAFEYTGTTGYNKFLFALGNINDEVVDAHTITIDNVYLSETHSFSFEEPSEPTTPEIEQNVGDLLIDDGHFTTDLGQFSLWKEWADATASVEEEAALIKVSSIAAGRAYDPQFIRNQLSLVQGNTYRITFKAKSDLARPIQMSVGQPLAFDPWFIAYLPSQKLELTSEYQQFTIDFVMDGTTTTTAQLVFECGEIAQTNIPTNIYFDDIQIEVLALK